MGLKKVKGAEAIDLSKQSNQTIHSPSVVIYHPALMQMKRLAVGLLGTTALTSADHIAAVHEAAAAAPEADDEEWSVEDALTIINAVGSFPAPTNFRLSRLKGEGTLLMRAVPPDTPRCRRITYSGRTPRITILKAMRKEGILVPEGQAMEVPVKLVEDEGSLALAIYLRRGKLRDVAEIKEEEPAERVTDEKSGEEE